MNSSDTPRVGWRGATKHTSRKKPCHVCGKFGKGCMTKLGGGATVCTQVTSDRPASWGLGGWVHVHDGGVPAVAVPVQVKPKEAPTLAPLEHRDGVYCWLLRGELSLTAAHLNGLRARGFSAEEIARNGYASTPSAERSEEVTASLSRFGLRGVPGFYLKSGRWRMVQTGGGFLIPYRDEHSRIQALQYRVDDASKGGKYIWLSSRSAPSGSPVHFARPHLLSETDEVLITEGALKSDLISFFLGVPVVAGAGVFNFGEGFAGRLGRLWPRGRRAVLCFDGDWRSNPHVRQALERMRAGLRGAGFAVRLRFWDSRYKGLDDYLLALRQSSASAEEVAA